MFGANAKIVDGTDADRAEAESYQLPLQVLQFQQLFHIFRRRAAE